MAAVVTPILTGIVGIAVGISVELFRRWDDVVYSRGARRLLTDALSDPNFEWRKFETLCRIVGSADEEQVRRWLIRIGARQSGDGESIWTLKRPTETILTKAERLDILRAELQRSGTSGCAIETLAQKARVTPASARRLLVELGAVENDGDSPVWQLVAP